MQKSVGGRGSAASAPTGCFKCGLPGHWSRDCPSSSSVSKLNPNPSKFSSSSSKFPPSQTRTGNNAQATPAAASVKKSLRTRPKLTPDILLSDDGIGYVLRHFPRSFKCRGRGHEVSDLGKLIGLYAEWHSRLLPYYSFEQFVQKVEKLGATRRVRRCISELEERVHNGGDISKLHEPLVEKIASEVENERTEEVNAVFHHGDFPLENQDIDEMQGQIFDEIYENATKGAAEEEPLIRDAASGVFEVEPCKIEITEEQKLRMEANRLKALKRAAAAAKAPDLQGLSRR